MKIADWILNEISVSIDTAKNSSQLESFRILERMTYRLGWRCLKNNPPLVDVLPKEETDKEEIPEAVSEIIKKTWVDARNSGSELKALDLFSKMKDGLVGN